MYLAIFTISAKCTDVKISPAKLFSASLEMDKNKSVFLPIQPLDPVLLPPEEQKQCVGEGIQPELLLHHSCQPVYPSPQVRVPTDKIHLVRSRKIV